MHEMALGLTYLDAIEECGGLPVVIPPLSPERIEPMLERLDGLCLSGGPDLDPVAYGQEADEHLGKTEPDLDRLGRGLVVSGRAADGVVEAVEDPSRDFVIGVQWHAELLVGRPHERALFVAFVVAAGSGVPRRL